MRITPLSDEEAHRGAARFLQSSLWARFKSQNGWNVLRLQVSVASHADVDEYSFCCTVFIRSFARQLFSIAYVPMAPELRASPPEEHIDEYSALLAALAAAFRSLFPPRTVCVRFDVPVDFYTVAERDRFAATVRSHARATGSRLQKPRVDIQPPDTVQLDLSKSCDELLAQMKSKWRYNIRLAQKKGVTVVTVRATDAVETVAAAVDAFYALAQMTAARDGIAIHSRRYYHDLCECARFAGKTAQEDCPPVVSIFIARHDGDDLAAIITLSTKHETVYLYGASSNSKRNFMAAYLLQWTAICDAHAYGSAWYDLYGIPPTKDSAHPMHGLYLFKTGFGGREVHRPGSFDVPLSPWYHIYAGAECIRAVYYKRIKKIFAGR
ncbi:MAG: peptidoglycan bridge formation glycyltransferase FemA/FemB family protein [Treponema sp.]|nr:peptidoglycan bridge formation glycyltransferase FemA/FemB family protein [Treponema sp.]